MIVLSMSLTVVAVGGITIGVGFLAGYVIEAADKQIGKHLSGEVNDDGISPVIASWLRDNNRSLSNSWAHLMQKFPSDYSELKI